MKCFYHDDMDGRAAGHVVHQSVGLHDGAKYKPEFVAVNYDKPFPLEAVGEGEQVWIVDYHLEPPDMDALLLRTEDVTWIDHHAKAIERLSQYDNLRGVRSSEDAGCVLTWKYVHWWTGRGDGPIDTSDHCSHTGLEVPWPLVWIGDRDMWTWKYRVDSTAFHLACGMHDTTPGSDFWHKVMYDSHQCVRVMDEGRHALQYRDQFYSDVRKHIAFEATLDGVEMLCMNVAHIGSEAFGDAFKQYPAVSTFFWNGKQFSVSLYSETVDVQVIARNHGGDGHTGASGFQCDALPYVVGEATP